MIVKLRWLPWSAAGITVFPFIFVQEEVGGSVLKNVLLHERVHLAQQRRWLVWGCGAGLIAWWLLYLVALPVWKNPWRQRWETEAYAAQGISHDYIITFLRSSPYFLWGAR